MATDRKVKSKKSWARELSEIIITALLLAFVIKVFVFELYKIPSGSMIPTLLVGDRIVVVKYIYGPRLPFISVRLPGFREPRIGDIVVFKSPDDPNKSFIKRYIAGEGDTVEIKNGKLLVNGKVVDDPPAFRRVYYYNRGDYGIEGKPITVPKNSYFVLGDNSASSKDSRYWGFVPRNYLIGKAVLVIMPFNRMQQINDR
ncbi:MAG TPA: signal peptidase I [Candidatus Omnitrophota bacterium]|nr:signal peptidase I [Candidatus Omnitrophota bacterium]HPN66857.1 signal peptidase I [Candidatus Omnitrophota bacterium]